MKKRMSVIVLAVEIAAIMVLHAFKIQHQPKIDNNQKAEEVSQLKISHSFSYTGLK